MSVPTCLYQLSCWWKLWWGAITFPISKKQCSDWNFEILLFRSYVTCLKLHLIGVWRKKIVGKVMEPHHNFPHLCISAPECQISILFWQGIFLGQSSYIWQQEYCLWLKADWYLLLKVRSVNLEKSKFWKNQNLKFKSLVFGF